MTVRWKSLFVAAILVASSLPAHAQVRGEIVGPGATRLPIAVPDLKFLGGVARQDAAQAFVRIVRADLELTGLFRVVDPLAYIDDAQSAGLTLGTINFDNWLSIGAMALVSGAYSGTPTGLTIEARFFDVADRSSAGGRKLAGDASTVARMAHRMADAVVEFVTGKPGPFESRIAFVSNRDGYFREIYEFTFDGRVRRLTQHRSITMAPSWHPSNEKLLFTSFKTGKPVLYSYDMETGFDVRVASKLGVNVGGVWSPRGDTLLVAREENGNTDIYELNPANGAVRQLTNHWNIDVDPAWSADGRSIAFCSSRSGKPQIYTMTRDGRNLRRITFSGDYNCSPAWSPDGRSIAYAGQVRGRFQIFVVPAAGGTPTQITSTGSNEDPSWSPDSRYLVYSGDRGGRKKLYMAMATGGWERQLTSGNGDDSSPSWSRRLE
jgi:TolB protein